MLCIFNLINLALTLFSQQCIFWYLLRQTLLLMESAFNLSSKWKRNPTGNFLNPLLCVWLLVKLSQDVTYWQSPFSIVHDFCNVKPLFVLIIPCHEKRKLRYCWCMQPSCLISALFLITRAVIKKEVLKWMNRK